MDSVTNYILLLNLLANPAIDNSSFTYQHYDVQSGKLDMHLVSSTTKGEVMLQVGNEMSQLEGARLERLFTLSVNVPCEHLQDGAILYWVTKRSLLHAPVPSQRCQLPRKIIPVKILDRQGSCWIDVGHNTLWRAAIEISRHNKETIYQNVYAIFLANRDAFIGEDINRIRTTLLRCPSDQLIKSISPEDALRLFKEMLEFQVQD